MPGKGRKVAARQAQVGRRRRRQPREGASIPGAGSGVVVAKNADKMPSGGTTDPDPQARNAQTSPRTVFSSRGGRSVGIRREQMSSNGLVKSEFIRISIMAGALTSVLLILAVVI